MTLAVERMVNSGIVGGEGGEVKDIKRAERKREEDEERCGEDEEGRRLG